MTLSKHQDVFHLLNPLRKIGWTPQLWLHPLLSAFLASTGKKGK